MTVTTDSAKRALLEHLIDDAGLFPPASLPMARALRHHARHAESAYAWIGGSFVLPASRIGEFLAARDAARTIELSVILDAGAQGAKGDVLRADLHRAEALATAGVRVAAYEARLPRVALDDAEAARSVATLAEFAPAHPVAFWYEAGWKTPAPSWLGALAAARASAPSHLRVGAKIRCGGNAPAPSADDLAAFIAAAQTHGVPWKATAGLHQPFAHAGAHGFVNLFFAGIAHHAGALDAGRIAEVVAEEDPRAFTLDPTHLAWRDVQVEAAQVAAGREQCVAFGSCSFDEPVNALREAGLIT